MSEINSSAKQPFLKERAQAIVEFAIALPILMLVLVGIFEVGRMVFIYAAVNNASREAARYASAVGLNDSGLHKYNNCAAIRQMAKRSTYFLNLSDANIDIRYDAGPNDAIYTDGHGPDTQTERNLLIPCDAASGEDAQVVVDSQDRVIVTVTAPYSPMLRLVPLRARTFTSTSARTILGIFELDN